jgi:hypothetical protein
MLNTILTAICENASGWTVLGEVRKRGLGRIEIRCTRIDVRGNGDFRTHPTEETPWAVGFWFIPQGTRRPYGSWRGYGNPARLVGTTCFQGTSFDSLEKRVRAEARACFSLPTCAEEAA